MLTLLTLLLAPIAAEGIIREGDRVVLIGGALIEREQQYGYLETMLHAMHPDRKFTVRNLGWSGDTVWGDARAGFGKQADGYRKLLEQIKATNPTLLFINYGSTEAFAGKADMQRFLDGYTKLVEDVLAQHPMVRFVFVMPPRQIHRLPKPEAGIKRELEYNDASAHYIGRLHFLTQTHPGKFIYLQELYERPKAQELTDDGLLPNEAGYKVLAKVVARQMGNTELAEKDLSSWDDIRQLIIRKNELYFHQYRPANDTYLFGFRKHEQGNNAVEMPKFTPLIEELDAKINEAKKQK
ncbi:MAG: SGNH/GDSL hydrolase family protein [Gemmatales bacterium]